ncbi:MAG: DUF5615 family PIN-like protein [bacterium]|nr:DUF5615 family PIN-like protein [bacterium]
MAEKPHEIFARLYLDEDVHKQLANALRLRGFDVLSVHEVWHAGLNDTQQLDYAVTEKRAIVTFNVADYVKLNKQYLTSDREHYGIIVSAQLPVGEMLRRLLGLLNKFTAGELKNNLWWL